MKFVIESYEEVGIIRTIDKKKATVVVLAMPDFLAHVWAILDSLREDMDWYEILPPEGQDDWLMRQVHAISAVV